MDDFQFKNDGTMMALSNQDEGTYRVVNTKIVCIHLFGAEYTLKFNDEYSEAILILPQRDPPSRMVL